MDSALGPRGPGGEGHQHECGGDGHSACRALAGNDTFDGSAVKAGTISLTLNDGDGDDVLTDRHGNDVIIGGRGNDRLIGGADDDNFVWNPGDGSDVVGHQAGTDTMQFNGASVGGNVYLSATAAACRCSAMWATS